MTEWNMFIDGAFQPAASGQREAIINPATEAPVAEVPLGSDADVEKAVSAARRAFREWSRLTPSKRSRMLYQLADAIEADIDELSRLESMNVGKPFFISRDDVEFSADNLRFFAGAARMLEGRAAGEYIKGHTSIIRREPIGVVASIAPWNYPLLMMAWKIGPALAAGNTVVIKPSEITPLTALRVAQLAADILPSGVLNVVTGHGLAVGAPLVSHSEVDMVSLTGSLATGKAIIKAAADSVKRVHMELGGKAPLVVLQDADIEAAALGTRRSAFYNAGQDCTAATRVLVHQRQYDDFVSALLSHVRDMQVGDPLGEAAIDMGPLVSKVHQQHVQGFAERASTAGADLLVGGTLPEQVGYYFQPTVFGRASQDSEIVQKEVFGPAITVQTYQTLDDAIAMANDTPYGLAASVWGTDVGRALQVSSELQFGTVWINQHTRLTPEMPHGGYKQSGYGKDMSIYSVEEYTNIKHVMVKL